MPRALKTYITNLGFFELAVAAPSMKAAIEAWGAPANVFHQGFARQTDDRRIVAATIAQPGVVLKRAVGSEDEFKLNAALPTGLPAIAPQTKPIRRTAKPPKLKKQTKANTKADKSSIISFDKERARRNAERDLQEAKAAKDRATRKRAVEAAEADLAEAETAHETVMEQIEREREKLDRRADLALERWKAKKGKLEEAIQKARR